MSGAPEQTDMAFKRLRLALERGTLPRQGVLICQVGHDDHCSLLRGAGPACDCDPEVYVGVGDRIARVLADGDVEFVSDPSQEMH